MVCSACEVQTLQQIASVFSSQVQLDQNDAARTTFYSIGASTGIRHTPIPITDQKRGYNMKTRFLKTALLPLVAATMVGCAGTSTSTTDTADADYTKRLAERERALEQRERALANRESSAAASSSNATMASTGDSLLPPNARAGECYARVWVDAKYEQETQRVKVRDESEKIKLIPAQYNWAEKQVLVKEAGTRLETVAAKYGTESETIMVKEGSRHWLTNLAPNSAPASDKLLAAAAGAGINLDGTQPGTCYHEHFTPAEYRTVTEDVLVSEASSRIETTDAEYEWVEERVLVADASSRLEEVAAVFKTETEKVLDKPAHTIWKKGTGPIQRIDEATGEIMCLVEVPATYKTVTKKVLVSPATTRSVEIPAQYEMVKVKKLVNAASERSIEIPAKYNAVQKQEMISDAQFVWHEVSDNSLSKNTRTGAKICLIEEQPKYKKVTRQVVVTPASTREVVIPAQYETVRVKELVSAAREEREVIPASYRDVSQRKLVEDGHMTWRSILCETNMTRNRISSIQKALADKGYNPGPIDGVIGQQTVAAVNAFQRAESLPVDRYLNIKTIEALGVSTR